MREFGTVVQKQHLCRFPENEKQPSLPGALGEAAAFGNSPAPVAEVIDGSWEILGLAHEEQCSGCQAAHAARGAQDEQRCRRMDMKD